MLKLDQQTCKDLDALYTDGRFERIMSWLDDSLHDYRERGDLLDGNDLYRNQGKCIILKELLDAIHTSRESLARIARKEKEGSAVG